MATTTTSVGNIQVNLVFIFFVSTQQGKGFNWISVSAGVYVCASMSLFFGWMMLYYICYQTPHDFPIELTCVPSKHTHPHRYELALTHLKLQTWVVSSSSSWSSSCCTFVHAIDMSSVVHTNIIRHMHIDTDICQRNSSLELKKIKIGHLPRHPHIRMFVSSCKLWFQ